MARGQKLEVWDRRREGLERRLDDSGIVDRISWLTYQGPCPGPRLGDGLGWTGVNSGGINQLRQNPV